MRENLKNARKGIIREVKKLDNDVVMRSLLLVIGDYGVTDNADERAGYIYATILNIVQCENTDSLRKIYTFSSVFAEHEAEKRGAVC